MLETIFYITGAITLYVVLLCIMIIAAAKVYLDVLLDWDYYRKKALNRAFTKEAQKGKERRDEMRKLLDEYEESER